MAYAGRSQPHNFNRLKLISASADARQFGGSNDKEGACVLSAILSAAASSIAVPAIKCVDIPGASPGLPLTASLGLTISYNVTIGIPLYMAIAQFFRVIKQRLGLLDPSFCMATT
jgi:uncharacterized protein